MLNERYRIAMAETLHYLKGISQDDVDKIPKKLMQFLKDNASQDYKCEFDYTKPLNELNLTDEARGLIAMICLNYWCETDEQKVKFRNHLNANEQVYQEELRKKYNVDDIFKKKDISSNMEVEPENINKLPIKVKSGNVFKRLFDCVFKFFNKE